MSEKDLIIRERVDHDGIFDFSAFYGFAYTWLKNENYLVIEERYAEKVVGNARDITVEWKASKKLGDYFKVEHSIKFEAKKLKEIEVEIEGKQKKMNQGNVSVEIKGMLVKDPDSKYETTPRYKTLRDVYNKYVIPGRVDAMEGRVGGDVMAFKDELKAFLELTGRR